MKAPISHLKDATLKDAPQALLRAAEKARILAEQTGHVLLCVSHLRLFQINKNNVECKA